MILGRYSGRSLLILLTIQAAAGCGYIKSLFPDKERDYQFRTEIPELIVPEDLKTRTFPDRGAVAPPPVAAVADVAPRTEPAAEAAPSAAKQLQPDSDATVEDKTADRQKTGKAAISSLQIDQPQKQAWRLVARALSRQKLEIIERNLDKGYFYVKYDPNETKPQDNTFWDEMMFLFGEDPSNEQEYRISLLEVSGESTEVTIQNSAGKTLSNAAATSLLKLITDGINLDIPADSQDNAPPP